MNILNFLLVLGLLVWTLECDVNLKGEKSYIQFITLLIYWIFDIYTINLLDF